LSLFLFLCHSFFVTLSFSFFLKLSLSLFLFSLSYTLFLLSFVIVSHTLSNIFTSLVCHAFLSSLCSLFVTFSMSLSQPLFLCNFLLHTLLSHTHSLPLSLFIVFSFCHNVFLSLSHTHYLCVTLFFLLRALFVTLSMSLPHSFPYALSLSHGFFLSNILLSSHTLFLSHILSLSQSHLSFFLMLSPFLCDTIAFSFFLMLSPSLFVKRSINFFSLCIPLSFKLAHIVFFFSFTFSPFPSTRLSCTSNIDCSN